MKTRLLVCRPDHYRIAYDINPWMTRNVGCATPDASRQWQRFVETVGVCGDVEIVELEPAPGLPELVFTGHAALVVGNLAILSTFRHPQRRSERAAARTALSRAGFATTYLQQTHFEGAGDALFDRLRPVLYAGYGWRSERFATLQLAEILGMRVVALQLADPMFYHLNTALCPLGSGHVMAYLAAFSAHAQRLIRRTVEPGYLIEVSREDALALACNAVEVGDAVVMHDASRRLRERLYDAGYRVFCTDLTEFHRAGGSAKCMTLRLDDGPAAVTTRSVA